MVHCNGSSPDRGHNYLHPKRKGWSTLFREHPQLPTPGSEPGQTPTAIMMKTTNTIARKSVRGKGKGRARDLGRLAQPESGMRMEGTQRDQPSVRSNTWVGSRHSSDSVRIVPARRGAAPEVTRRQALAYSEADRLVDEYIEAAKATFKNTLKEIGHAAEFFALSEGGRAIRPTDQVGADGKHHAFSHQCGACCCFYSNLCIEFDRGLEELRLMEESERFAIERLEIQREAYSREANPGCERDRILDDEELEWTLLLNSHAVELRSVRRLEQARHNERVLILEETTVRRKLVNEFTDLLSNILESELKVFKAGLPKFYADLPPLCTLVKSTVGRTQLGCVPHHYVGETSSLSRPLGTMGAVSWWEEFTPGNIGYETSLLTSDWVTLWPGDLVYSIVGQRADSRRWKNGDWDLGEVLGLADGKDVRPLKHLGTFRSGDQLVQLSILQTAADWPSLPVRLRAPLKPIHRATAPSTDGILARMLGERKQRIRAAYDLVAKTAPAPLVAILNDYKLACLEGQMEIEPGVLLDTLRDAYLQVQPDGPPPELA